jgi:hypothetical protein
MDNLRERIRNGIEKGRVPSVECLVTWFGPGRGEVCVVCSSRILGSELAIECDLRTGNTAWFHAPCYDLWLSVRGAC